MDREVFTFGTPDALAAALLSPDTVQPYEALLTDGDIIPGCTVFARAECFRLTGGFNPEYRYAQDYDYWLRMASRYQIGFLDEVHVLSREHPWQASKEDARWTLSASFWPSYAGRRTSAV